MLGTTRRGVAGSGANDSFESGNVFGDDAIELFLDDPSIQGHYFHIAINAKNISYDAKADGAMNFDKSWNPQFTSKTSIGTNSWILDVKLPFQSFGIDAKENTDWKMSFKRDGASCRANTGWPDASYHNPAGFGTVELVKPYLGNDSLSGKSNFPDPTARRMPRRFRIGPI